MRSECSSQTLKVRQKQHTNATGFIFHFLHCLRFHLQMSSVLHFLYCKNKDAPFLSRAADKDACVEVDDYLHSGPNAACVFTRGVVEWLVWGAKWGPCLHCQYLQWHMLDECWLAAGNRTCASLNGPLMSPSQQIQVRSISSNPHWAMLSSIRKSPSSFREKKSFKSFEESAGAPRFYSRVDSASLGWQASFA